MKFQELGGKVLNAYWPKLEWKWNIFKRNHVLVRGQVLFQNVKRVIVIYHMLKEKVPYRELGADYYSIINQENMQVNKPAKGELIKNNSSCIDRIPGTGQTVRQCHRPGMLGAANTTGHIVQKVIVSFKSFVLFHMQYPFQSSDSVFLRKLRPY